MNGMARAWMAAMVLSCSVFGMPQPPQDHPPERGRPWEGGPPGNWWTNQALVERLGLTEDQRKKIEDLFQQNRLKLVDLNASLRKEEIILEPLLAADRPEEAKVLRQIDRIAQARAELEKANARMLLGFRGVLTHDQWNKLQAEHAGPEHDGRRGPPRGR